MIKRILGNTGIEVSEIAFGGVEIGIPYGINVKNESDMLSETEAIKLLHTSLDSGINFYDTARMYGNSEMIMGKAFSNWRNEIVLGTKCRHFRDEKGKIPAYPKLKKIIESSLNESLKALQTDYVDIFMLHSVDIEILDNEYVAEIFMSLKKEGRFRATGVSTYAPGETKKAIETGVWDVIQLPFNLMDQRQSEFFSMAHDKGTGLVNRSVLLKGILSDKGRNLHPALKKVETHLKYYNELSKETLTDLSGLAIKFALSFPEISAVLVGIDRLEYLHKSLEIADGKYLDKNNLARAKALSFPDPDFLNLPYWDKMNWLR